MGNTSYNETAFIGFTINGTHSSSLGLLRVSDGSRYVDQLLPPIKNKEVEVPGGNGTYYMGTSFGARNFPISVAFDNITEEKFKNIKSLFGTNKLYKLVFDEAPYKYYNVKLDSPPDFKYLCFDGAGGERIYKGEGTLNFIAFDPFGYSTKLFLSEFDGDTSEWAAASGMPDTGTGYNIYDPDQRKMRVYNAGIREMPFNLIIPFVASLIPQFNIQLVIDAEKMLALRQVIAKEGDEAIQINMKLNLIEGVKKINNIYIPTGTIYNEFVWGGQFFKLPPSSELPPATSLVLSAAGLTLNHTMIINYQYIYF